MKRFRPIRLRSEVEAKVLRESLVHVPRTRGFRWWSIRPVYGFGMAALLIMLAGVWRWSLMPMESAPHFVVSPIKDSSAVLAHLVGEGRGVQVRESSTKLWRSARQGESFRQGSDLRITDDSVTIETHQGRWVCESGSQLSIRVLETSRCELGLEQGGVMMTHNSSRGELTVSSSAGRAKALGTVFSVKLLAGLMMVSVSEGAVELKNDKGRVVAKAGEQATASSNQTPKISPTAWPTLGIGVEVLSALPQVDGELTDGCWRPHGQKTKGPWHVRIGQVKFQLALGGAWQPDHVQQKANGWEWLLYHRDTEGEVVYRWGVLSGTLWSQMDLRGEQGNFVTRSWTPQMKCQARFGKTMICETILDVSRLDGWGWGGGAKGWWALQEKVVREGAIESSPWFRVGFMNESRIDPEPKRPPLTEEGMPDRLRELIKKPISQMTPEEQFDLAIYHAEWWTSFERLVRKGTTFEEVVAFNKHQPQLAMAAIGSDAFLKQTEDILGEMPEENKRGMYDMVVKQMKSKLKDEGSTVPYEDVWRLLKECPRKEQFMARLPKEWMRRHEPFLMDMKSEVGMGGHVWQLPPPSLRTFVEATDEEYEVMRMNPFVGRHDTRKRGKGMVILGDDTMEAMEASTAEQKELNQLFFSGASFAELVEFGRAHPHALSAGTFHVWWNDENFKLSHRSREGLFEMSEEEFEAWRKHVLWNVLENYRSNNLMPPDSLLRWEVAQPGKVWLGVRTKLSEGKTGVLVTKVFASSPASTAKISVKDLVIEIEGKKVSTPDQLRDLVAQYSVGARIEVTVLREGQLLILPVVLAKP